MDEVIMQVNSVCGLHLALELASTFFRFEALAQLVYQGGSSYYEHLYNHIDNGNYPLNEAIQAIYRCERRHLRVAVARQAGDHRHAVHLQVGDRCSGRSGLRANRAYSWHMARYLQVPGATFGVQ